MKKYIKDGFDYSLQVWVRNYIILDCSHPKVMKENGCCNRHKYANKDIREIQKDLK